MRHRTQPSLTIHLCVKPLLLSLLVGLIGVVPNAVLAHDIEVTNGDGVTMYYVWTNNQTELAVSYRGDNFIANSNRYTGHVVIPETVTYNGNTYPVITIGDYAFYGCSDLTSVTIPNSVSTIGYDAFYNCI